MSYNIISIIQFTLFTYRELYALVPNKTLAGKLP